MRRTTRHPGYRISTIKRKQIEEPFGWMKTVGGLRKTRHRGRAGILTAFAPEIFDREVALFLIASLREAC